jgi:hypothetical protein
MTKKGFIFGLSGAALLIGLTVIGCGSAPTAEVSKDKETEKGKPAMEETLGKSLLELTQLLHPLELQDLGNGQYVVKGYPLEGQLCIFAFSNGKSTQCELIFANDQFETLADSTIKQSGEPSTKEENQWTWNKPGLSVYVYRKAVDGGTMTGLGMQLVEASLNRLAGTKWIMKGRLGDLELIFVDETCYEAISKSDLLGGTWSGTYSLDGDYVYTVAADNPDDKLSYKISNDGNTLVDRFGNSYTKVK